MNLIDADDQMFGNFYYTTIKLKIDKIVGKYIPFGEQEDNCLHFSGQRPHIAWGCNGIVKISDDEWHLLDEDDGHYWTAAIITEKQLEAIRAGINELKSNIKEVRKGKAVKYHFVNGIPKIKSDYFNFHYDFKGNAISLITINIIDLSGGEEYSTRMHPFWLRDLIKVFNLVERDAAKNIE